MSAPPRIASGFLKFMHQGDVNRYWRVIMASIKIAFGEHCTDSVIANVMAELRNGLIQCWAIMARRDGRLVLLGLLTTRIIKDRRFGRKALYIETLSSYGRMTASVWDECMKTLSDYAKDNDCAIIEADVANDALAKMAERFGFTPITTRIRKEL